MKQNQTLFRGTCSNMTSFSIGRKIVQYCNDFYNYNFYNFCNQPVLFAQHENVNELWNNNRIEHVNGRNQNKNKTKSRHIQIAHARLFDSAPKQCFGVIKG